MRKRYYLVASDSETCILGVDTVEVREDNIVKLYRRGNVISKAMFTENDAKRLCFVHEWVRFVRQANGENI